MFAKISRIFLVFNEYTLCWYRLKEDGIAFQIQVKIITDTIPEMEKFTLKRSQTTAHRRFFF